MHEVWATPVIRRALLEAALPGPCPPAAGIQASCQVALPARPPCLCQAPASPFWAPTLGWAAPTWLPLPVPLLGLHLPRREGGRKKPLLEPCLCHWSPPLREVYGVWLPDGLWTLLHIYQMHKEELLHTKYLLSAAEPLWARIYSRSVSQGCPLEYWKGTWLVVLKRQPRWKKI